MRTYTVFEHVPYEGQHEIFNGTKSELKAWVNSEEFKRWGTSFDDLTVYVDTDLDLLSLLKPER